MLSNILGSAGAAQGKEDKPPRSVFRYRVKNAVKKCTKAIKKQVKNLHK